MTDILSPIVLFVYNRPDILQKVLFNLRQNPEISSSKLIVFSDGPKKEEDSNRVNEVRKLISEITWCKETVLVSAQENMGLTKSIIAGVTKVLEEHETVIVLEDDLLVGKGFLSYMNAALSLYRDNVQVISISAYIYPIKKAVPDTFFLRGADCLGWATWKRGWRLFEADGKKLLDELVTRKLEKEFDYEGNYPFTDMLKKQTETNSYSWAVLWNASAFLRDKLTLYPYRSLVKHIGINGTNYSSDPFMDKILFTDTITVQPVPIVESKQGKNAFVEFFKERKVYLEEKKQGSKFSAARLVKRIFKLFGIHLFYKRLFSPVQPNEKSVNFFSGNYDKWETAASRATGYDRLTIFDKVKDATDKVIKGQALYERDSVLFYETDKWSCVDDLLEIAADNNNMLTVLDFGGALGSLYFQNRKNLSGINKLRWGIIEQKHYVDHGRAHVANQELKFYYDLDEAFKEIRPDVIILSSVIQYLKKPYELLQTILNRGAKYLIIDRTCFFSDDRSEAITIQYVDPAIFEATIPLHILNLNSFLNTIGQKYRLLRTFECEEIKYVDLNCNIPHKGFVFSLK